MPSSVPEFYLDETFKDGGRVMFACPHQNRFTTLPNCIWQVVTADPLTVTPSIFNTSCGCHGWITEGKWVPA